MLPSGLLLSFDLTVSSFPVGAGFGAFGLNIHVLIISFHIHDSLKILGFYALNFPGSTKQPIVFFLVPVTYGGATGSSVSFYSGFSWSGPPLAVVNREKRALLPHEAQGALIVPGVVIFLAKLRCG